MKKFHFYIDILERLHKLPKLTLSVSFYLKKINVATRKIKNYMWFHYTFIG